jgi:hypothetical protein
LHDFANYYYGGALLEGGRFNPSVYFPADFNKAIIKLGGRDIFASYAPNTPFLALLFMPFSLLPAMVAKLIFNLGSLLLLLRSVHRLTTFYKIEPVYLLLIPVFSSSQSAMNCCLGRFTCWSLASSAKVGWRIKKQTF